MEIVFCTKAQSDFMIQFCTNEGPQSLMGSNPEDQNLTSDAISNG